MPNCAPHIRAPYHIPMTMRTPARTLFLGSVLLAFLGGCRDSSIATYRIPKETDTPRIEAATASHGAVASDVTSGPQLAKAEGASLSWTAPAHWKPKTTSSMRKGSYV